MTNIVLPNVRKVIVPDPGYVMFDADLAGADAQVVAWEAEDEDLKAAFRAGLDVHDKNARDMWGTSYTSLAGDKDKGPKSRKRKQCKQGVHLTNYGGTPKAIAMVLGWTVHEGDKFQKRWFSIHPGIKEKFQRKVDRDLNQNKTVTNRFGFRRIYFDRPEKCYTEALAWIPQSTVALTTYLGAFQLEAAYPRLKARNDIILQCHDNLVFQFPKAEAPSKADLRKALGVPIPYDDPLTIPWGLATSEKSWGDVSEAA